ncbi:radical SAM protein [Crocinitomix catalasitica]|uniref:radical SAM protein n=1 Tax=Crocinitomix catalasitica TaxID=184607 RepID=UPI001FDEBC3F|nr:radical SAM protein [Crocinitomix catalasitica]
MIYGTELCDSGCKHCLIWAKRPVVHLSYKKILEIMQSKCVNKDTIIGLEGGEFLLHPDANKILEWFKNNHPNFDLLTNCLKPDNVIDCVKKFTPKRLFVSLDGNRETYKYMRGKDGYDDVLKVIEACKDCCPISVMFTLSPYNNFADLDHVIEVCKNYGIDVRIGVYNDIEFFDTIEKAHETDISACLDNEKLTFKKVKEELKQKSEEKKQFLNKSQYEKISIPKHNLSGQSIITEFQKLIPNAVKETSENFDFLLLYDDWRKKHTNLKCYSILDSAVVHPNGDVPICQNLGLKLGNVHANSLDEIFNSVATQQTQKKYVHNCNQCWINFHRKYDIVMLRTLEKYFPKRIIEVIYGKYRWSFDEKLTYKEYMKKYEA